jgi:membrane protease YdiL (CAAX protease family)
MQLNKWPLEASGYKTTDAYGSFVISQIVGAIVFGVFSALTVALVLPGGEPLYRAARPQFLRLRNVFTSRGVRTKEFFLSTIVGLSLAAAQMGFLVAFYLIANHFGAWSPQEIKYDDSLNTAIPWIGGLAIGLLAATSEEFLFRMFAIPFLAKVTKSRVLAVMLPAFAWGFLHTAYPNEPPYIRGLEVGLIGIAVGIVMLYWGILATLIWHYTVDASLVGLLLIRSSSPYLRVFGVVIGLAALIPFAAAVYWRVRRGTFEDDTDLTNAAPDPVPAPRAAESAREVLVAPTGPLSTGVLGFLVVCLLLGGLAAWKLKPVHLGDYLKLSVSGREATRLARETLQQQGVDPQKYHSTTIFADDTDPVANEFLREKVGIRALNEIYEKRVPGALWIARFFRDGDAEEYAVWLRPDGSLESVNHKLAEKTPGPSLSKDDAVARATAFLQNVKNVDLSHWALVDSTSDKKPQRLDHKLIWQENEPLDGASLADSSDAAKHAYTRVQVAVLGDEVTNFHRFIKIPDQWRRKQEQQSVPRTLYTVLLLCFIAVLGLSGLYFFLREIKSELMRQVPWRRFTMWALFGLLAYVCNSLFGNGLTQAFFHKYDTAMPLKFMYGLLGIGTLIGGFFSAGTIIFLFAIGWFFLRQAFGERELPGWRGMPNYYYRDALLIGAGGTGALLALGRVTEWASAHWPTQHRAVSAAFGMDFDALLPGIAISAGSAQRGLLLCGLVVAVSGFIVAHCKSPVMRGLLFVLGSLAMVGDWGSTADFAKQWITHIVFLAVVAFGVMKVARLNLLGYFLVLTIPPMILGSVELLSQPNGFFDHQGIVCVLALAILLAIPFAAWMTSKHAPPVEHAQ